MTYCVLGMPITSVTINETIPQHSSMFPSLFLVMLHVPWPTDFDLLMDVSSTDISLSVPICLLNNSQCIVFTVTFSRGQIGRSQLKWLAYMEWESQI